jgi:hypothetical protein
MSGPPPPAGGPLPPDFNARAEAVKADELRRKALAEEEARWAMTLNILVMAGVIALLAAVIVFVLPALQEPYRTLVMYLTVGVLSGLVGYGELVSRYQDRPADLLSASGTVLYVLVNATAGIAALGIVLATGTLSSAHPAWLFQLMLAGFGAIAFFRTSLFTVRIGGTDVGIGPSALLQSLLNAADRMLDRGQAEGRAVDVASIMRNVDFKKARATLPAFCLILVQNVTPADQEQLGRQIEALGSRTDIEDPAKAIILGVYLIRAVGPDVLGRSVAALADLIVRIDPPASSNPPSGGA